MEKIDVENLFRKQAIQSLKRKPPGRPICLAPRPWAWLTTLVLIVFVGGAFILSNFEYARRESVRGWVVANPGVVRIAAKNTALIHDVVRAAGERVQRGDPLVYLSTDSELVVGESKNEQQLAQLRQDIAELDSQLAMTAERDRLNGSSLESQLQDFDREIDVLQSQSREQRRRLELGQIKLQRIERAAASGAISEWDLLQQRQGLLSLELELGGIEQAISSARRERERLGNRVTSKPLEAGIERSALRVQRSNLTRQIAEIESRRLSILSSPVSGMVSSVQASTGNTAAAGQLLMTVIPKDVELSAEVYVPSRAAGFLQKGQPVRLSYDAFPKQTFGVFEGRIEHISDFVLLPRDIPEMLPIREATYKVRVRLIEPHIATNLDVAILRPGMLLLAEIVLEEKNLFGWLVESLFSPAGLTT